jgi:hypothetical protein
VRESSCTRGAGVGRDEGFAFVRTTNAADAAAASNDSDPTMKSARVRRGELDKERRPGSREIP